MKKKITRILGVVLTLVLLSSFLIVSAPVGADDQAWGTFTTPLTTGMVLNTTITAASAFAQSPVDGALYAAVTDAGVITLLKSTDGGRTWTAITTFVTVPAVAATGSVDILDGVDTVDLGLNIDGAAVTLAYGDDADAIAAKIAAAVLAGGATTTATAAGAVVTFTHQTPGSAGNVGVTILDASYYNSNTVPAITLTGGADPIAQVDEVTPTSVDDTLYILSITPVSTGIAVVFSFTSDATATAGEIADAFAALITADPTIPVSAANVGDELILTADVEGIADGFTAVDVGPGTLTVVSDGTGNSFLAANAVAATDDITIPSGVDTVDLTLNIDGVAITLTYGSSRSAIATIIAAAVLAGGATTTATVLGTTVTFTAITPGTGANGVLAMADASYYNGNAVSAITLAGGANAGGAVPAVAVVPSPTEANVVFYISGATLYRSNDGGVTFLTVLNAPTNEAFTALDIAQWGGRYFAIVGTNNVNASGGVLYWDENDIANNLVTWGSSGSTFGFAVLSLTLAPTFNVDRAMVVAGVSGNGTIVRTNVNGGAWGAVIANLTIGAGAAAPSAADIAFPTDFNVLTSPVYYVAVSDADAADGGLYRVIGTAATRIDTGLTWNNLSVHGPWAGLAGTILVGSSVGTVSRSSNSGFTLSTVTLRSNVATVTAWVLIDKDYATNLQAYVLNLGGAGAAFNVSINSMANFNQWSLVNETLTNILDLAVASNGDMFMIATPANSIWRYFGAVWERVAVGITGNIIRISEDYVTDNVVAYTQATTANNIFISANNANSFTAQSAQPGSTFGGANTVTALLVLGANSVVVGSTGGVITTTTVGFYWPEVIVALGTVQSFDVAANGDIVAGGSAGFAVSTDNGVTWTRQAQPAGFTVTLAVFGEDYVNTGEIFATGTAAGDAGVHSWIWGTSTAWTRIDLPFAGDPFDGVTTGNTEDVNMGVGIVTGPGGPDGMVYAADGSAAGEGVTRIKGNRKVAEQLPDAGTTFMGLWYQPGSNVLYTIDTTAAPDVIRTYTDTLNVAGEDVAISAITAGTFTVNWTALLKATTYTVAVDLVPGITNIYTAAASATNAFFLAGVTAPLNIVGAVANTTYYVSVWADAPVSSYLFDGASESFTTLPAAPIAPLANLMPVNGAVNVPINDLAFGWRAATGGAVSYNWNLTTDPTPVSATDPTFANITEGSQNPTLTLLVWAGPLEYDTSYYWQVRSVGITGPSAWVTSVFTTVAEAAPPVTIPPQITPIITVPPITFPPVVTPIITMPPVQITVVPPAITVVVPDVIVNIPDAPPPIAIEETAPVYIWAIIGIGAVLVIAVIVLIVRTRRVV